MSYTYQNRLRTGLSLQAPNASAWTQSYGYYSARRLTNVVSPAGTFSYVLGGASSASPLIKKLLLPNGAFITNSYDGNARLLSTVLKNSGGTNLDSYTYTYNAGNQRTNVVRTAGDSVSYTYDNEGELKTAIGREAGGVTNRLQEQLGYAYDAAGNLNQRTNNALIQNFGVNNLNELSTVTRSGTLTVAGTTTSPATNVTVNSLAANIYGDATFALGGFSLVDGNNSFTAIAQDSYGRRDTNSITVNLPATNSYSYDLNGNLLSDGNRNFAYDDENQLTSVWVTNVWRSDFVYDGKLRRRIERDYQWDAGTSGWLQTNEVHYIYDGNLVIQERDANNLPLVTYTRGNDLSRTLQGAGGIGGLLARTDNSTLNSQPSTAHAYYHADGNGNITMLISSSQMIVAKYLYDPYGNTLAQSGLLADANLYRFSSKEWNANSGLYYYLYRFYDPNLQRWPNRDPLGEAGGYNVYQFAGNNPADAIDPLGDVWYKPWTWFSSPTPLVPLDSGGSRQDISRAELEQQMSPSGPISPSVSSDLNRGCIGLACAYQGLGQQFPENAPGTQCYLTETEARARTCSSCDKNFVFAKQGQWSSGTPTPDKTGQVPTTSVSSAGGNYNYVTSFPSTGSYAWMNNGVYPGAPPQRGRIAPFYPNDPHYPQTIWCSTCVKK